MAIARKKIVWKTPEPGQVEIQPEGGAPFRGPREVTPPNWMNDLQVGDLLTNELALRELYHAIGPHRSPLPFLSGDSWDPAYPAGQIFMYLGTQRTNEFHGTGMNIVRRVRHIVLVGGKKYFLQDYHAFKPI